MISHTHKFIFIHINKTGGTSIEKCFIEDADVNKISFKHADIKYYFENHQDVFSNYFKFTFVRNSWDWLVSRYHWSRYQQNLINYSFNEFIFKLTSREELNPEAPWLNQALKSQSSRIQIDNSTQIDFIGRFESLQSDFNTICDKINKSKTQLNHVFKSDHQHYSNYYVPKTIELVSEYYKQDIDLFKFKFEENG